MTDKYPKLRQDLAAAIADAKRQGGVNERAEQIAALLAERDTLAAAPVSAEPVAHRLLRRNGDGEWVHDAKHWVNGWPPPELIRDCGQTPELYRIEVACAAPIAAQAAEIAALRAALEEMVNEPQPTGIDRPVYQMALAALEKSDAALSGESNAS